MADRKKKRNKREYLREVSRIDPDREISSDEEFFPDVDSMPESSVYEEDEEVEKPSKQEYAVAKHLRFNVPVKEGKLVGMTVQYFIASKAIDGLLESKWSSAKTKEDPLFTNRVSCIRYCQTLLEKGMFHRAAKVEKRKEKKKKKKEKESEKEEEEDEDKKKRKEKKSKKDKLKEEKEKEKESEREEEKEKEKDEKKDEKKKEKKEKKSKTLKLAMHDDQLFVDGEEVYVWIYDPVPLKTFIIGLLLVLGATGVCLFPLWPPEVRLGVYYISLVAAGFVGAFFALCIIRLLLFCGIWCVTMGKHHFWLFPNLLEDVGIIDSFKPLYQHDYTGGDEKTETTDESQPQKSNEKQSKVEEEEDGKDNKEGEEKEGEGEEEEEDKGETGSDKSENGYEIVDKDELTESQDQEEAETKKDK